MWGEGLRPDADFFQFLAQKTHYLRGHRLNQVRRNTFLAIALLLAAIAISGTLAVMNMYNLRG